MVETLAGLGVRFPEIASQVKASNGKGISVITLRRYFRDELDQGVVKANAKVARSLFENATGGNVAAQIFWLKTRAGWTEGPQGIAIVDEDGKAQKIQPVPTLADFMQTVAIARSSPVDDADEGGE